MPERTAMVVYNGAVLHGPERSIKFLQTAFNGLGMTIEGKPLKIDGIVGANTIAAAQRTDSTALANAYIDLQESFFRKLEDFDTFGKGWLNRSANLREFISTLPQGAGIRPKKAMAIAEGMSEAGFDAILAENVSRDVVGGRVNLIGLLGAALSAQGTDAGKFRDTLKAIVDLLDQTSVSKASNSSKPALTPVNAALGEGIGRMLDGKKSIIGVVGIILTVLIPEIWQGGTIVDFVRNNSASLTTLLATFTGWGFLGKMDKAIRGQQIES
jgi:peptidoglycan L-alanyl-D-glutamate endopeptidase CwlK